MNILERVELSRTNIVRVIKQYSYASPAAGLLLDGEPVPRYSAIQSAHTLLTVLIPPWISYCLLFPVIDP